MKGAVTDGGEGVGQVQRGEACAPVKGVVADGGEGVGQVQRGEACAPVKGAVTDGGEGVGQVQRGEACAPGKGVVTDGGEGVGQVQRGEACAPVKGNSPMAVTDEGRTTFAKSVRSRNAELGMEVVPSGTCRIPSTTVGSQVAPPSSPLSSLDPDLDPSEPDHIFPLCAPLLNGNRWQRSNGARARLFEWRRRRPCLWPVWLVWLGGA